MKKATTKISMIILISIISFGIVHAQTEEIMLNLSRDFGYSSGTGKIQGLFSMKVTSSIQLIEVKFFIDTIMIGTDTSEPFKIQFSTDDYAIGVHKVYVIGTTLEGQELQSREIKVEFVSAQEGNKAALSIIIPMIGLVLVIGIISITIPILTARKRGFIPSGTARNYGIAGGTICSKCKRPFALHFMAPNMLMGKLERCPHCGKWGLVRSFPLEKLREAEKNELVSLEQGNSFIAARDEENLKNELEDSKYQGL
jgi:hypothetical protein